MWAKIVIKKSGIDFSGEAKDLLSMLWMATDTILWHIADDLDETPYELCKMFTTRLIKEMARKDKVQGKARVVQQIANAKDKKDLASKKK